MATNADKKNEARVKREQAQAAADAAAKRNKMLQYLAGAVFAAIVVVVLVVLITGKKDEGGGIGSDAQADVQGVAATKKLLAGVPQNGLTIGDPKAPVTILEFIDVQCPFCKDHQLDDQPQVVNELVRTGKAKLRLMPIALTFMGEDSEAGRTVAIRLAAKDKAWPFLNLFFWNQGQEQTGYVTDEYLKKLVVAAGGDAADATPRSPNAEEAAKLKEIDDLQSPLGVTGTPSFAVGKTGADPATYEKIELSGSGSTAEQLADAVEKISGESGATTPAS